MSHALIETVKEIADFTDTPIDSFLANLGEQYDRAAALAHTSLVERSRLALEVEEVKTAQPLNDYQALRAAVEAGNEDSFVLPPDTVGPTEAARVEAVRFNEAAKANQKVIARQIEEEVLSGDQVEKWLAKVFAKAITPPKGKKFTLAEAEGFRAARAAVVQKIQALVIQRARHQGATKTELGTIVDGIAATIEAGEGSLTTLATVSHAVAVRQAEKRRKEKEAGEAKKKANAEYAAANAKGNIGRALAGAGT
jgi:hypothetical protein